jgi:uncharacterized protein YndB with AHSA1/START domain
MTTVLLNHRILVQAPLQRAFEYVSDLTRHPEWSEGDLKIEEISPGPIATGKEYASRGEFGIQKERRNTVRITLYEPPHRFGFAANDPNAGEVIHVFTFKKQEQGVLIEREMTLALNPLVALVFRFLIYPFVGRPAMDKSLALLKEKLELP